MEIDESVEEGSGASAVHQTMQISHLNQLHKDKCQPSELHDEYEELRREYK